MSNLETLLLSDSQQLMYQRMLADKGLRSPSRFQIEASAHGQPVPLCSFQEPLWFIDGYMGGDVAHNVVYPMGLPEGAIDLSALRKATMRMLERHEILRSTFTLRDETPVQIVQPLQLPEIEVVDLTELPDDRKEAAGWALVDKEARRVFDLQTGPLVTFTLLKVSSDKAALIVSLHHIVCDTWSVSIIDREIRTHYDDIVNAKPWTLPEMRIQFADYAAWQRAQCANGSYDKDLAFWVEKLASAPVLRLPVDRPISEKRTYPASNSLVFINESLLQRIKRFAETQGVTLYMVLLAGFNAMLARHTGDDDIVVGTPHSNRELGEISDVIGFTINSLALRNDLSNNPSFAELVQRVRLSALEAYEHHQAPFQLVVEALNAVNRGRVLSRHSLFRAFFSLQNIRWSDLGLPQINTGELHSKPRFTVPHPTTKYDIYMYLRERDGKVLGGLEYDEELFDAVRIERMIRHFIALLDAGVANPTIGIHFLPMLSEAEQNQLRAWNGTARGDVCRCDIGAQLHFSALSHGAKVAVTDGTAALSFVDLNKRSNQFAHFLRARGVQPEQCVGLLADRTLAMTVALLGILKTGATCVALDKQMPPDRIATLVSAASISVVLSDDAAMVGAGALPVLTFDGDYSAFSTTLPELPPSTSDLGAFAFFTSGSTGAPNVVVLTHGAVLSAQMPDSCPHPLPSDAKFLLTCPVSSARLPGEILWPLLGGATTVVAPPGAHRDPELIARLLADHSITHVSAMPQIIKLMIGTGRLRECGALRWVYCVGEYLERKLVAQFQAHCGAVLCNTYAQTEACPVAFFPVDFELSAGCSPQRFLAVGRAAPNSQIYILDPYMQPTACGVTGEIYVGGAHLARGYLADPRLTAEKFVPDPFGEAGSRLYRTGDFGRQDETGNLWLMGRRDQRVKILGNRIELGEVERALMECDGIEQAVVVVSDEPADASAIVAFVKLALDSAEYAPHRANIAEHREAPLAQRMQHRLLKTLPQYMVPTHIQRIEEFPRGRTGKIDRQQLLASLSQLPVEPDDAAADTAVSELEQTLIEIWAEVLGKRSNEIDIYDSFFELGGHSLLAAKIVKRVQQRLGVKVEVRSVFEAVTIAGLCDLIEAAGSFVEIEFDR